MSKDIKNYIDNFDLDKLSFLEQNLYNKLRLSYPKRLCLIKMVMNSKTNQSYYLEELKQILKENEKSN